MELSNNPFSSNNDSSTAIYIFTENKHPIEFIYETLNKYFGRVDLFKDKFPLQVLRNIEEIEQKLSRIIGEYNIFSVKVINCIYCNISLDLK